MAAETEAFGIKTHGMRVIWALEKHIPNPIGPETEPEIISEKGAVALIDGNSGFSQLAMREAKRIASEKAREFGIAMVAIRNASWLGALGIYLVSLAEDGLFAQLWGQSSQCRDSAPVGGIDPTFSTNPFAFAFPTHDVPMIADMSTSSVSLGKVGQLLAAGEKAPEKIFMDSDGGLTDDPSVVGKGGSILFAGGLHYGHKGYTLSLWAEALTAMGGGSCNNPEKDQRQSLNLTVIDPEAFAGLDYYTPEMERFIKHVKESRVRPGCQEIRIPGERGFAAMREAGERGVPLENDLAEKLNETAQKNGVDSIFKEQ
jgi:L-lactate dehydrogenase